MKRRFRIVSILLVAVLVSLGLASQSFAALPIKITRNLGAEKIYLDYDPPIQAVEDKEMTVNTTPTTQIVNGDFSEHPTYMGLGVDYERNARKKAAVTTSGSAVTVTFSDGGDTYTGVPTKNWLTTESKKESHCGTGQTYFEWINNYFGDKPSNSYGGSVWRRLDNNVYLDNTSDNGIRINPFVEMNSNNPATLYQDLDTKPGDIIYWSLNHGVRTSSGSPVEQKIRVIVGKPTRTGGEVDHPTSNANTATSLKLSSYTIYERDGSTDKIEDYTLSGGTYTKKVDAGGNPITSGYKNSKGLENLNLTTSAQKWKNVGGAYKVPGGQELTRFAFQSGSSGSMGNFLDDIVFQTLVSGLKVEKDGDNIIVSGYWGAVDDPSAPTKLEYEFEDKYGNTYKGEVDMSNVKDSDFIAKVPIPENIKDDYKFVDVYPEGFPGSGEKKERDTISDTTKTNIPRETSKPANKKQVLFSKILS